MKSRLLPVLVIAMLCAALPAHACINESRKGFRYEGLGAMNAEGARLVRHLVTPASQTALVPWSRQVIKSARHQPSFDNLNDLAVVLIRHGRHAEAVTLLQFLERSYPGRYPTAANIGTAYELLGQNHNALKWILEGIKRNPDGHHGTEWLHVHILKAKMGQLPSAAPGKSILNLDFGKEITPKLRKPLLVDNAGRPLSMADLTRALRYQLTERIQFVAAPDAMVAGLLLDWANLELMGGSAASASVLFDAALRYGSAEAATIALRRPLVAEMVAAQKKKHEQREACIAMVEEEGGPFDECFQP